MAVEFVDFPAAHYEASLVNDSAFLRQFQHLFGILQRNFVFPFIACGSGGNTFYGNVAMVTFGADSYR